MALYDGDPLPPKNWDGPMFGEDRMVLIMKDTGQLQEGTGSHNALSSRLSGRRKGRTLEYDT